MSETEKEKPKENDASKPAEKATAEPADTHSSAPSKPKGQALQKIKAGVQGLLKDVSQSLVEMAAGLKKMILAPFQAVKAVFVGDALTKLLALGFLASLALLSISSKQLYQRYLAKYFVSKPHALVKKDTAIEKFMAEQKEIELAEANLVFLERFTAPIQSKLGNIKVFEIELYIECTETEAAQVLKANINAARDLVSSAVQGQIYEELMTDPGKEKLKKQIADFINRFLEKQHSSGKVKRVFLTQLVMA